MQHSLFGIERAGAARVFRLVGARVRGARRVQVPHPSSPGCPPEEKGRAANRKTIIGPFQGYADASNPKGRSHRTISCDDGSRRPSPGAVARGAGQADRVSQGIESSDRRAFRLRRRARRARRRRRRDQQRRQHDRRRRPHESSGSKGINGNQNDTSLYDSGAVYVFARARHDVEQQAYIKASNADTGAEFGHTVALSADGNTLAVAAIWESSSAKGVNGNQNDRSVPQAGAVYVFTRQNNRWTQQAYIKASNTGEGPAAGEDYGDGDQFGFQ